MFFENLNLDELDLTLKLLAGEPIKFEEGIISPLTLRQIARIGYTNYAKGLNLFSLKLEDFIEDPLQLAEAREQDVKPFDFLILIEDDFFQNYVKETFAMFFKTEIENIQIFQNIGSIIVDGLPNNTYNINRLNFPVLKQIIEFQNGVTSIKDGESGANPSSDKAKEILERMQKMKEKVKEAKSQDDEKDSISIADIISAVASRSNSLNKLNVFDLTIYQLYDELKRLELIDKYELAIKSLLKGAKDVDLKHWSTKLD
jgi:hypothetical protein